MGSSHIFLCLLRFLRSYDKDTPIDVTIVAIKFLTFISNKEVFMLETDEELMPKSREDEKSLQAMCSLISLIQKDGKGFAPGMMSLDKKPIVVLYKKFPVLKNRNPFSYVEDANGFKIIAVQEELPENVREFIAQYEMYFLVKKHPENSFFGENTSALWFAIQNCSNGFRTCIEYHRLKEALE